jgi:hypothetical protein
LQARGRARLGRANLLTLSDSVNGSGSIEQCRKVEDIPRANQKSACATYDYEITVKLVLRSSITNL